MAPNRNVSLAFTYRIFDGLATGVWASSVLSNFISLSSGGSDSANEKVGIAQAIQGTCLVAVALPAAWAASLVRRDTILKLASLATLAAIACTTAAILLFQDDPETQFKVLCSGLALWGAAQANSPVLDSLFADSVPTGHERARLWTKLHISYVLSQGLGPALAAIIFMLSGNQWSAEQMRHVMLVGMVLALIPAYILLLFSDDDSLGLESEGLLKLIAQPERNPGANRHVGGGNLAQPLLADHEHDLEGFDLPAGMQTPTGQAGAVGGSSPDKQIPSGLSPSYPPCSIPPSPAASPPAAVPEWMRPRSSQPGTSGAESPTAPALDMGQVEAGAAAQLNSEFESHALDIVDSETASYSSRSSAASSRRALDTSLAGCGAIAWGADVMTLMPSLPEVEVEEEGHEPPATEWSRPVGGRSLRAQVLRAMTADRLSRNEVASTSMTKAEAEGCAPPRATPALPPSPQPEAVPAVSSGNQAQQTTPMAHGLPIWPAAEENGAIPTPFSTSEVQSQGGAGGVSAQPAPGVQAQGGAGVQAQGRAGVQAQSGAGVASEAGGAASAGVGVRSSEPSRDGKRRPGAGVDHTLAKHPSLEQAGTVATVPWGKKSGWQAGGMNGAASKVGPASLGQEAAAAAAAASSPMDVEQAASYPTDLEPLLAERNVCGCLGVASIPLILALSDCVMGLASGMTVKFFPVFFRSEVHLSPTALSLMYSIIPLSLSVAAAAAQGVSTVLGRVPTMILLRACGILLLFVIASMPERWGQANLIVPLFVIRTSVINSLYPLQRAILFDYVSKANRAKWASLETVTAFGWSGSAAVGGWLLSVYGFQYTFLITCVMQAVGWACSFLLLPIVPLHAPSAVEVARAQQARANQQTRGAP